MIKASPKWTKGDLCFPVPIPPHNVDLAPLVDEAPEGRFCRFFDDVAPQTTAAACDRAVGELSGELSLSFLQGEVHGLFVRLALHLRRISPHKVAAFQMEVEDAGS